MISSQRKKRLCFRVICKCQICIFGGLEEKLDFEDLCTIKRQTLEEIMKNDNLGGIRKIVHEICKYILCCLKCVSVVEMRCEFIVHFARVLNSF